LNFDEILFWLYFSDVYTKLRNRFKNYHFSMSSRLALGPTQLPIQWVPRVLSAQGKAEEGLS
jgi:hypothetical protein